MIELDDYNLISDMVNLQLAKQCLQALSKPGKEVAQVIYKIDKRIYEISQEINSN